MTIFDVKNGASYFKVGDSFSPLDRVALAAQHAARLLCDPNLMRKAPATCGPCAVQRLLANGAFPTARVDFLETVLQLAYDGNAVINGTTVELPPVSIVPQPQHITWDDSTGEQDYASYLFQLGLVDYIGQRWRPKMRFLPGWGDVPDQWRLLEPAGSSSQAGTLINYDVPGDTTLVDRTGGLTPPQLSGLVYELLGYEQSVLNARSYPYAEAPTGNFPTQPDQGLAYVDSVEELHLLVQQPRIANIVIEVLLATDQQLIPTGMLPDTFVLVEALTSDPTLVHVLNPFPKSGGLMTVTVQRLFQALTGKP